MILNKPSGSYVAGPDDLQTTAYHDNPDVPEPDYAFDPQDVTNTIRQRAVERIKIIRELQTENHNLRRLLWTLYTED